MIIDVTFAFEYEIVIEFWGSVFIESIIDVLVNKSMTVVVGNGNKITLKKHHYAKTY